MSDEHPISLLATYFFTLHRRGATIQPPSANRKHHVVRDKLISQSYAEEHFQS